MEKQNYTSSRIITLFKRMQNENSWWNGEIITPLDMEYESCSYLFNKRTQTYPAIIIRPTSTEEASLVMKYAYQNNIPVRLRGGGHSDEGYSSWNDGVQLDTRLMKGIIYSPSQGTLSAEAGVLWSEIYLKLDNTNHIAIGGLEPSVGVIGFVTGGGFNHFLSRNFGMGCDNVVIFKVIKYDGDIITVDKNQHSDLWWALKGGGGGNFGLITEVKLNLHKSSSDGRDQYIFHEYIYNIPSTSVYKKIIHQWDKYTTELDKKNEYRVGTVMQFQPNTELVSSNIGRIAIKILWCGGKKNSHVMHKWCELWEKYNFDFTVKKISHLSWLEFVKQGDTQWEAECPFHLRWYGASAFVKSLSKTTIDLITSQTNAVTSIMFEKGKYDKCNLSSFAHRQGKYLINPMFFWKNKDKDSHILSEAKKWMEQMTRLDEYIGSYVNYINASLSDWPKHYYGDNLEKLISIKQKYDPNNYWQFPQSIPTGNNYIVFPSENSFSPTVQKLFNITRNNPNLFDQIELIWESSVEKHKTLTKGQHILQMAIYFEKWIKLLPMPESEQKWDSYFTPFYSNKKGKALIKIPLFANWLREFVNARADYMNSPESTSIIHQWEKLPEFNMNEFDVPTGGYKSFNHFFTRRLKKGVRIIEEIENPNQVIIPADCTIGVVNLRNKIPIKSDNLTLSKILGSKSLANNFRSGSAYYCHLSPLDYHRWHSPITGKIIEVKALGKSLWPVEGTVSDNEFYGGNQRLVYVINSICNNNIYKVVLVAVGNSVVSSVNSLVVKDQHVQKGEEIGYFAYGGSAILLLFETEIIRTKLLTNNQSTKVKMGMKLGEISKQQIDVMIPVAEKDLHLLNTVIHNICVYSLTPIRRIYVVWQNTGKVPPIKSKDLDYPIDIRFVDEKSYPFKLDEIKKFIHTKIGNSNQANWYFQQLLKLYSFKVLDDVLPKLLIHDADILFNLPIKFIDSTGRSILSYGYPFKWLLNVKSLNEYGNINDIKHSHIYHAKRLVPKWELNNTFSGMHHHQLLDKSIMDDLFEIIERYHEKSFWKVFMEALHFEKWNSASEYVIYFHFALQHHSDKVTARHMSSVDVIRDNDDEENISIMQIASKYPTNIIGIHRFINLKERIETMDYIPDNLRKKILSNKIILLQCYLNNGVLNISTEIG